MSDALLQDALRLRRAGKLTEAAELYGQLLSANPRHFEALHALGILRYQGGRLEEAEKLIGEASALNPKAADAAYNHACLLQRLNRPEAALASFDRALAVKPDYVEALVNRGAVLSVLKRYDEALDNCERVLALNPNIAEAWGNRASMLQATGRLPEALESYDRALALKPNVAETWKNRSAVLMLLQRYEDALLAIDKAIALVPDNAEFLCRRADLLALLSRPEDAARAYEQYLVLKPDDADAWHARGFALKILRRRTEALSCFDKAVMLAPKNAAIRASRANMLFEVERFGDAACDYEILLAEEGAPAWVQGYLTMCRLHCCDWRGLGDARARISHELKAGHFVLDPTGNAIVSSSLEEQQRCARIWAAEKYPRAEPLWRGERYRHERIRIAYLSADFRTHATAFLMAGVFEHHDRSRFETLAVSYSTDDKSPMRARLEAGFDRFLDVQDKSDAEVARALRELEIDIAVDLKGYTAEGRPAILAHRPAPVQAHYLGFPGTMGVDYVDYLIADSIVVPREHQPFYAEKLAYLPDTYQCNDRKRRMAERAPRIEAGLQGSFVFCCFNNNHKITPEIFDIWMRLLRGVEGSVLWLLQDNAAVVANLRSEAVARGVTPERLIFAPRTDPATHLARQTLADLFVDTLPYNAHTTASDALWAGLPIVTMLGPTFASRVAGSLLHAAGLPELVTNSHADYEALALRLARDPTALAAVKAKVRRNRDLCPLFDTARFTQNLESAYNLMWERYQRGLPPATFAVKGDAGA